MKSRFGLNVEDAILMRLVVCLGQYVPVLPIGVLKISEYCFAHVGGPKLCYNLSRQSGYFSAAPIHQSTLFYPEVKGACLL